MSIVIVFLIANTCKPGKADFQLSPTSRRRIDENWSVLCVEHEIVAFEFI